jgi:hypothetical protein
MWESQHASENYITGSVMTVVVTRRLRKLHKKECHNEKSYRKLEKTR